MAVIRYLIYLIFFDSPETRKQAGEQMILPAIQKVIHSFEK